MIQTTMIYKGTSVWSGDAPHLRIGDPIRVGSTLLSVTNARLITHDGGRLTQVVLVG